jgi:AraC family transcriptional regulator, transcriptional activator of pobA
VAMAHEIPQYSLYGESVQDVDERFLHVESIAERSAVHDWKIRPHAHRDLHHLLLVQKGGGILQVEDKEHAFRSTALIALPLACVHGFEFRPDTDGWIVTASGALMDRIERVYPALAPVLRESSVTRLNAAAARTAGNAFSALVTEFRSQLPARRVAAELWLMAVMVQTLRCQIEAVPAARSGGADTELAIRYRALIEANFAKPVRVYDYAKRLFVSHERLRQACLRMTGSAPLELLNARRLLEAKRCLLYTSMSVGVIAEYCGFEDPAYFSRFFTRATGKSPLRYRNVQRRSTTSADT